MRKKLQGVLIFLVTSIGCIQKKDDSYERALLRVKNFLAFSDSVTKVSSSIHQLEFYYSQLRETLNTKIIPFLDSISINLSGAKAKNIQTLKTYLEVYFKRPQSAEDFNKQKELEKEVENILKEAKKR